MTDDTTKPTGGKPAIMTVKATSNILHGGVAYAAGDTLEVTRAEFDALLAAAVVAAPKAAKA